MAYTEEDKYKHQAYQFLIGQMLKNKQVEMGGLADLIRAAEIYPEAGSAALARYGINVAPGLSRRDQLLRQQMQIAAFRNALKGSQGGLPPDLVGAIGTPDFQTRVRDAASTGAIDRQSLQTLYDLDRRERDFAARNRAKPGKLSPAAQKLRELDALGIPITEDTVRGVYTPTAIVPSPIDPTRRNRPVSLSALAGLTGGATETAEAMPVEEESPGVSEIDARRNRMRQVLGGEY